MFSLSLRAAGVAIRFFFVIYCPHPFMLHNALLFCNNVPSATQPLFITGKAMERHIVGDGVLDIPLKALLKTAGCRRRQPLQTSQYVLL